MEKEDWACSSFTPEFKDLTAFSLHESLINPQKHSARRQVMQANTNPQVRPNSADPLAKKASTGGEHWQNPADPTRKDGDVPPIYAEDRRLDQGEDLEEPQSDTHATSEDKPLQTKPKNSGEVSKVY
jgi:hypothetical protein